MQNSNINDLHLLNVNQDILNSLVSPLRKDFIYGIFFYFFYFFQIFIKKNGVQKKSQFLNPPFVNMENNFCS